MDANEETLLEDSDAEHEANEVEEVSDFQPGVQQKVRLDAQNLQRHHLIQLQHAELRKDVPPLAYKGLAAPGSNMSAFFDYWEKQHKK